MLKKIIKDSLLKRDGAVQYRSKLELEKNRVFFLFCWYLCLVSKISVLSWSQTP